MGPHHSSKPEEGKHAEPVKDESQQDKYNVIYELTRSWPSDPRIIRSESLILLIAGRDTTASVLTNLLFHLARSLGVWQKIRQECLALTTEMPTIEELKDLNYLNNFVREGKALRYYEAPFIHQLPSGVYFTNTHSSLSSSTNFNLWIYAMHHRKDIWGEDADEFRPERWDDGDEALSSLLAHHAYSPFGAGVRIWYVIQICLNTSVMWRSLVRSVLTTNSIGQQLAQTEIIYTTFRLARKFSAIQPADSQPWTENLGLATSSAYGTRVRLIE